MTATATLDITGDLRRNPFAEMLVEISQANLSGSLRLSKENQKAVVYLKNGHVVHAVSNQRDHRLFSIGLERKKFTKELLAKYPNFANDVEFSAALKSSGQYSEQELKDLRAVQTELILIDTLTWTEGEWTYSPHARLRNDLVSDVDAHRILIDFARCAPGKVVLERFRSVDEVFGKSGNIGANIVLQPHEKFVLDQFDDGRLSIAQLRTTCTLPEGGLLQAIYTLWLGGILIRFEWTSALTAAKLGAIRTAKFARVNEAAAMPDDGPAVKAEAEPAVETPAPKIPEPELSIGEYLEQVEKAETHYDLLGIDQKASLADIKAKYFTYAKNFHPDRFHREEAENHRRIQNAFTKLAHAYETLKTEEGREAYNYKVGKELELRAKRVAAGQAEDAAPEDIQTEKGLESFELGLGLYQEEEYAAAATQLARAVHYSPQNALYRAYYGKALSYSNEKYRHKAESELQTAVKLDPKNSKIRMMLIEFFMDMNMQKRAEGELRRFLQIAPGDKEALAMMNRMQAQMG